MKNTVNTRIGLLKNKFNMDSKQFVAKTNISPTTLWSIEKGADLKPKTVKLIADAFGVSFHWLMTGEGEMMAEQTNDPQTPEKGNITKALDLLEQQLIKKDEQISKLLEMFQKVNFQKALNSTGLPKSKLLRAQA